MTTTDDTYNGWTNKATWLVKLWIDNDQGTQEYWLERAKVSGDDRYALAKELEYSIGEDANELGITSTASMFSDLMSWALAMVNWDEITKTLIEDAEEING